MEGSELKFKRLIAWGCGSSGFGMLSFWGCGLWKAQCIESGRLITRGCGNSVREHGIVEVEKRLRASRHGKLRDFDGSDHGMLRAWDCS